MVTEGSPRRDSSSAGNAIVTGGASGIGRATAILLSQQGWSVTIGDLSATICDAVVTEIRSQGGSAQAIVTDVTSDAAVAALVDHAVEAFGPLTGAVNAAGIHGAGKSFEQLTLADLDQNLNVNARAIFLCMQHQIAAMERHGRGSIVNVASTAATHGVPRSADYCTSKAAVMGLTRGAAADYATRGIRINGILPAATRTPMLQSAMDQDPTMEATLKALHPIGRIAEPTEIASAICWLLSEGASFVTGQAIAIDGGQGPLMCNM